MSIVKRIAVFIIVGLVVVVKSAPTNNSEENTPSTSTSTAPQYDLSGFNEVYDQRQNGSENYRVNIDGVVVLWTPSGGLLQAASLLDPALFGGDDYSELEEFFIVNSQQSSTTTTSSTTKAPPPLSLETSEKTDIPASQSPTEVTRRRFRVPGFIKPFIKRRRTN